MCKIAVKVSSLQNAKLAFSEPVIVGTGGWHDSRKRSWARTLKEHGDWGRHLAHKETVQSQTNEGILIPSNPRDSFMKGMDLLSEAAINESRSMGQKDQAAKLKSAQESTKLRKEAAACLEIALMNELYYGTNSPDDRKRVADIKEALANNKVEGHEGLSGGILDKSVVVGGNGTGATKPPQPVSSASAGASKKKT